MLESPSAERLVDDAFGRPTANTAAATHASRLARTHQAQALITAKNQARWLNAYAKCGIIGVACADAKVPRRTVSEWQAKDEVFATLMREAFADAKDYVEGLLHTRVVEGISTPMTVAGKREVVRRYSDALLLARVKALKPEVYDRQPERGTAPTIIGSQTNNLVVPLERLSEEQFRLLETVYGQAGPQIVDVPKPQVLASGDGAGE